MTAEIIPLRRGKDKKYEPVLKDPSDPKSAIPHFRRYVESNIIYYRKTFKKLGIPLLDVSTGEITLGKARAKASVLQQQHLNKYLGIDDSHIFLKKKGNTFSEISKWVLKNYTPTQRTGTQENHKIYIDELNKYWGLLDLNAITPDTFKDLIVTLRKEKKRRTFADYQKHANLVMRKAYENKYVSHLVKFPNPDKIYLQELRNKKRDHKKLTKEEEETLELKSSTLLTRAEISALWENLTENTRDQFVLSFECMMRLREVLYLTWERCDLKTGIITLRAEDVKTGSKTGKGRSFRMSKHALKRMQARFEKRPISPYVFPSPSSLLKPVRDNRSAWKMAKSKAKITRKCRWHDLRHTALTFSLLGDPSLLHELRKAQRKEPLIISEYAGVSMRTIQQVYLKSDANATQEAADAVRVFSLEKDEE